MPHGVGTHDYGVTRKMSEEIPLIKLDISEERLPAPFQHPSGKRRLRALIVKLMPEHEVYCEPFCGMASVFFAKPPSKVEILSDIQPERIKLLRFLRDSTASDWAALVRREWRGSEARWEALRTSKPTSRLDQIYRLMYLLRYSYRDALSRGHYSQAQAAESRGSFPMRLLHNHQAYKERLRNTKILEGDFEPIVRKVDSAKTSFYFDPPYIGEDIHGQYPGTGEDAEAIVRRLIRFAKTSRGKWIMTHSRNAHVARLIGSSAEIRTVTMREPTPYKGEVGERTEMVIANFKLPERLRIVHVSKGIAVAETFLGSLEETASQDLRKIPVKEINPSTLRREDDKQVLNLHLRMHQLWGSLGQRDSLDGTTREDIANAHYFVAQELARRDFRHFMHDSLDDTLREAPLGKEMRKIYVERAKPAWRIFALEDLGDVPAFKDPDTEVMVDVKWDGERIQMLKHEGKVEVWSDYPRRIESRLPYQVEELGKMKLDNFRLDSEAVMLNPETKEALHRTMVTALLNGKFDPSERAKMLHLMVFDCLEFAGEDLKEKPLLERIERLRKFAETDHIHFMTDYLSKDPDKDALGYILPRNHKRFEAIVKRLAEK